MNEPGITKNTSKTLDLPRSANLSIQINPSSSSPPSFINQSNSTPSAVSLSTNGANVSQGAPLGHTQPACRNRSINATIDNAINAVIQQKKSTSSTSQDGIDPKRIPIGDGKISTTGPKRGYIYQAASANPPGGGPGGGAIKDGDWINGDGTWDSTKKAVVEGEESWDSKLSITTKGNKRFIRTNNLPSSTTGKFPIDRNSDAGQVDPNPNSIGAHDYSVSLPANPKPAAKASPLTNGPIGILVNGSVLFNGVDATGKDAVAHEVQDKNQGHPESNSAYHHHSIPDFMWKNDDPTKPSTKAVGWALDGYPITGPRGKDGKMLTNDDLDEFHGTTSEVEIDGKMVNMYHYVATLEYPYTLGAFKGTPAKVDGYKEPGPPGGGPPPQQGAAASDGHTGHTH